MEPIIAAAAAASAPELFGFLSIDFVGVFEAELISLICSGIPSRGGGEMLGPLSSPLLLLLLLPEPELTPGPTRFVMFCLRARLLAIF